MATQREPYYSPEEYIALERSAEYKSEYLGGQIFAMAGASEDHNTIATDILWNLRNQFQGQPCRVYMSDMRVRVAPNGYILTRMSQPCAVPASSLMTIAIRCSILP